MFSALLFCSLAFAESKTLALQIALDRAGFSCNTIDGTWGKKSELALAAFEKVKGSRGQESKSERVQEAKGKGQRSKVKGQTEDDNHHCLTSNLRPLTSSSITHHSPAAAFDRYFANVGNLFRVETVTQADLDALVKIPESPSAKAALPRMGYESIKEMFAERGHLSQIALTNMNPGVDWNNIAAGTKLVIPDFPPIAEEFKAAERGKPKRPAAALVRVSITNCLITAYDANGRILAQFPCSIAANKTKVPATGELKITSYVAWPNYTYTPDYTPPGKKVVRHVWPAGENCPVGVAWMGLNLPGYGIHGTPRPESIGFTGSHGCFRLANWNAARLFAMCKSGTRVIIDP